MKNEDLNPEEHFESKNPITMSHLKKIVVIFLIGIFSLTSLTKAYSQSYNTYVSTAWSYPPYLYMVDAIGTVQGARFVSAPYNRKVNSTNNVWVGNMTYGNPPYIYGHASVVFQYTPATNTINIFPNQCHITTWWGNQTCRVYENGTCNCGTNPNWYICNLGYYSNLILCAQQVRINTINYLVSQGFTVTQNNSTEDIDKNDELRKLDIFNENLILDESDFLFQEKAKKQIDLELVRPEPNKERK